MLEELKQKVFKANLDLVKHNLVIFTWGNVSAIDREKGLVVIKPSGVEYDVMKASDMVVVDLETGKVVEGELNHDCIPCTDSMTAEQMPEYEKETGVVIVNRFKKDNINPVHTPAVLVKNHGPFAWGKDADQAVYHAVVAEQVAKMAFVSFCVNPQTTMNPLLVEKHFSRKHGPNAYYGQKKK